MPYKRVDNLKFEDARIIFRNFAGEETKFNRRGNRNFCVIIEDEERARAMLEDGWNVKTLRPRDDDEEPKYYLPVSVGFEYNPPAVYILNGGRRTAVDEGNIDILDHADYRTADLIVRPYCWDVNGKSGIKGYLKTMYVTIEEDDLERKYSSYGEEDDPGDVPWD